MSLNAKNTTVLTPKETVARLDKYIIGQDDAKKKVAIAMRNRYRRAKLSEGGSHEVYGSRICWKRCRVHDKRSRNKVRYGCQDAKNQ